MYRMKQIQLTNKKIMISTTLNISDYQYCKENKLMFSRMLENAINIHRIAKENGINEDYNNYLKRRLDNLSAKLQHMQTFLEQEKLTDKYLNQDGN